MRRLLAPLSRWLDRRIDARIAVADAIAAEREAEEFRLTLDHMRANRQHRSPSAGVVHDAVGPLPAGHVALAEMTVAAISDAATVQREGR